MAALLASALLVEGVFTGFWLVRLLPAIVVYDWSVLVLAGARAVTGAVQFTCAPRIWGRQAAGYRIGRYVLIGSAVLLTFEIGFRLAPGSLQPALRWPVVGAYWVYASTATWLLRREENKIS